MTQERRLADLERNFGAWERKKLLRTSALVAVPVLVALGWWGYGRVEVESARESVVSLTQSLNAEQQAKAGLEAQLAKAGVRLAELQQSVDQVGTERDEARAAVDAANSSAAGKLAELAGKLDTANEQVRSLTAERDALASRLEEATNTAAASEKRVADLDGQIARLTAEGEQARGETQQARLSADELAKARDQAIAERDQARAAAADAAELRQRLTQAEQRLAGAATEIDALQKIRADSSTTCRPGSPPAPSAPMRWNRRPRSSTMPSPPWSRHVPRPRRCSGRWPSCRPRPVLAPCV
jgi:hypothetical protein